MKILFVHQNFPAQFSQIAAHLAKQTGNELLALKQPPAANFEGVGVVPYRFLHDTQTALHPLLGEKHIRSHCWKIHIWALCRFILCFCAKLHQ